MDLAIGLLFMIATAFMVYGALYDWRCYRIPYVTIVIVAVTGLIYCIQVGASIPRTVIVSLLSGILLFFLSKALGYLKDREVLGYGDLQLLMASLLWLDIEQLPWFLILTGLSGIVLAKLFDWSYFPFAPGIGLAWFLTMML